MFDIDEFPFVCCFSLCKIKIKTCDKKAVDDFVVGRGATPLLSAMSHCEFGRWNFPPLVFKPPVYKPSE